MLSKQKKKKAKVQPVQLVMFVAKDPDYSAPARPATLQQLKATVMKQT
jgi:hypothetical protein